MSQLVGRYSMEIRWSVEDDAYIVELPEFPGCMTHGSTRAESVRQGEEVLELLISSWEEDGKPLPDPQMFEFEERDG